MQQQWDGFRSAEPDGPPPVTSADGDQPGPSDAGGPDLTDLTAFEGDLPAMPSATAISWTGEDEVDRTIGRLAELHTLSTGDHVEVFEDIHRGLQDTLAHLDGS